MQLARKKGFDNGRRKFVWRQANRHRQSGDTALRETW